ncbi:MAG: biopolymer transporter ExbD [Planctomycetes bacterium]|nr:biopolymer transporter ExbD [Planctomycetota bacterium]
MSRKRDTSPGTLEVDLTPMIDMVFQLIIFFIVVIDFTQKDLEDVEPPKVRYGAVEDKPDPERLLINITRPGEIVIKADTMFLPQPAREMLSRTTKGAKKLQRLEARVRELEGLTLADLETDERLVNRISRYGLEMELKDKTEGKTPKDKEARIQFLDTAPTAAGAGDPLKVIDIPLLIRADKWTPFYSVSDVLEKCLPSADPSYSKKAPTDRDPAFPFKKVEFSTKKDQDGLNKENAQGSP